MKLTVNEIFYSLQGEGGRCGEASVFIRLTKCNLNCSFCDTEFENGEELSLEDILFRIKKYPCKWIIWTGGEPTIQLKDAHLAFFRKHSYKQAIETNGTRPVPSLIDYISCSPKQDFESIKSRLPIVDEIRIPIEKDAPIPDISILPEATFYFLSPVFDSDKINDENVRYCVELIKKNPQWRLSLQIHKLIHIE